MTETLKKTLPYFSNITVRKGLNILNEFEEAEYYGGPGGMRPGTVLEEEGKQCQYIYSIIRGQIHYYKRIPGLYQKCDQELKGIDDDFVSKLVTIDHNKPL